jgi:hypothetical protein
MDKHIRELKKDLAGGKPPLKIVALTRTGKSHYKATVEDEHGKRLEYFLANSESDHRAAKNRLCEIRRFFNN